jgi:hypothetical protein
MSEETIFATAPEKTDPAERAADSDPACAGDPELRGVKALLRAHEQSRDHLDPPVPEPRPRTEPATTPGGDGASARPTTEGPGTRVGPGGRNGAAA